MSFPNEHLQKKLDAIRFNELKVLFMMLAIGLNENTKFIEVPRGTGAWRTPHMSKTGYHETTIELVEFFGEYIGYDAESNIVVHWKKS